MPTIEFTLQDGSKKSVEFDAMPSESDIEEVSKSLSSNSSFQVPTQQPAQVTTPKPYKKALEQEPANYKQNVDKLYNIPQVPMPQQQNTFKVDSNGKMLYTQNATNQAYQQIRNNPNLTTEQKVAEIKRIGEERNKQIEKEHNQNMARIGFGATMQAVSAHPIFNIPYIGTGLGGAMFDAGGAIMEGKSGKEIAKDAGKGFVIGETIGAVPYVGRYASKTKAGQAVINKTVNSGVGRAVQRGAETIANNPTVKRVGDELVKERQFSVGRAKPKVQTTAQVADDIIENIPHELKTEAKIVGAEGADIPIVNEIENIAPTQTLDDIISPTNPQIAQRGAVDTIRKNFGDDVANQITDTNYNIRGKDVLQNEYNNLSEDAKQVLLNTDEVTDLSVYAKAQHIKDSIANGEIPVAKLNQWAKEGTTQGQAFQARKYLTPDTVEGAVAQTVNYIHKTQPKHVQQLLDDVPNIVKNVQKELTPEQKEKAIENMLKTRVIKKTARKSLIDKIMQLEDLGGMNEENLTKLLNKEFNVPEITKDGLKTFEELTSNIRNAEEGSREKEVAFALLNKHIGSYLPKSWQNKVDVYRYGNMLLSDKSRYKDFILTGVNAGQDAMNEAVATGIDSLRAKLTGNERVYSGLHPLEWAKGFGKGFKEGVEDVRLGINTSRSGETGRYGLPKTPTFEYKPISELNTEGLSPFRKALMENKQRINNVLSRGEDLLKYTINVPDRAFYEGRFAASKADQLKAQEIKEATDDIIEQAIKEAKEATYQDDSWVSEMSQFMRKLLNIPSERVESFFNLPANSVPRVGNYTEPFITTPANLINQGFKYTTGLPLGGLKLARATTPAEVRDAELLMAKGLFGLASGGTLGYNIANNSIHSNIGNDNYQENEITGLKPQSVVLGNRAFSMQNMPTMSIPTAIYGGLFSGEPTQALINAGNAMADIPALKSLNELANAVQGRYGEDLSAKEVVDNLLRAEGANIVSQFIPAQGQLGAIRNELDPIAREVYSDNTLQYIGNRMKNRLPYASTTLPIKYNAIGEPVYVNNNKTLGRRVASEAVDFGGRYYTPDETYTQLNQFKEDMKDSDISGKSLVGVGRAKRTIKVNGEDLKLDNRQYSEYQYAYGKLNKNIKGESYRIYKNQGMPEDEIAKELAAMDKSIREAIAIKQFEHKPSKKWQDYTADILENWDELIER